MAVPSEMTVTDYRLKRIDLIGGLAVILLTAFLLFVAMRVKVFPSRKAAPPAEHSVPTNDSAQSPAQPLSVSAIGNVVHIHSPAEDLIPVLIPYHAPRFDKPDLPSTHPPSLASDR